MKLVLFDHGTPRGLAPALKGHTVHTARARGWETLRNGELLDAPDPEPKPEHEPGTLNQEP